MQPDPFKIAPISHHVWSEKYRLVNTDKGQEDGTVADTWARVARAAASKEAGGPEAQSEWASKFEDIMSSFAFLPAGRIIAGAGTQRDVTLFNCFVMGKIEDDLEAIFDNVKEAARTMQLGGGIGHDFSTLRPKGALVKSIGADASGPISFMDVWDAMCRTIMSAGARRGAMMGTMRCDHPDIEDFIAAKADANRLRNFNLSVLVTDAFMAAIEQDKDWKLVFNDKVWRTVKARDLWEKIMQATYDYAEPGVIFIDRINAANNLAYCEEIRCTNPCGEQPLPAYGACLLGSINLARLVSNPFEPRATIDIEQLQRHVKTSIRLLDNIIDVSNYPLPEQEAEAKAKRRIGLGVTGLADALAMCGERYGSQASAKLAANWLSAVQNAAYLSSAELAEEKGAFPLFDAEQFLKRPNIQRLDTSVRDAIARHGIRNGCLTSIAPTGTISLLAGNVSSGIEPIFSKRYTRRILERDGSHRTEVVEDYAVALFHEIHGANTALPETFVTAEDLSPSEHLRMQAALQPFVDSSISKTINCPEDISFDAFKSVYLDAYKQGLKGCTTFRPNDVTGAVLVADEGKTDMIAEKQSEVAALQTKLANPSLPTTPTPGVVKLMEPLERDQSLPGFTYKLKWPGNADALYVTVNDIIQDGRRRPFEIFINTKNLEHYAWTVALTRMISAVFRRGGDVSFVVEELKAIFDPQGGRWMDGEYVPSLLAAIGNIIENHMITTGFLKDKDSVPAPSPLAAVANAETSDLKAPSADRPSQVSLGRSCPQCGRHSLTRREGCWLCLDCGYSHCG